MSGDEHEKHIKTTYCLNTRKYLFIYHKKQLQHLTIKSMKEGSIYSYIYTQHSPTSIQLLALNIYSVKAVSKRFET